MRKTRSTSTVKSILWRTIPHILVVVVAYGFMVLGGYWFCLIEGWSSDSPKENVTEKLLELKQNTTERIVKISYPITLGQLGVEQFRDIKRELDDYVSNVNAAKKAAKPSGWNLLDGFLYAFSTVTTIGYGHLLTETDAGRIFYVFYGLIGIPLFTLAMADIGLFLEKFMSWFYVKILHCCSAKFGICRSWSTRKRIVPAESLLALPIVLFIFIFYTAIGGLILPFWEYQWSFVEAFYVAFDTITTIGIGDLYPLNNDWFLATVVYVSIGIAIGCVAIGALSDYVKVLHHFGTDPSDCGMEVIWFGGKHMRVAEFVRVVGKELGSTDYEIKTLQHGLDRIVNEAFIERRNSRVRHSYMGGNDLYPEGNVPLKLVNYGIQPHPNLYHEDDFLKERSDDIKF